MKNGFTSRLCAASILVLLLLSLFGGCAMADLQPSASGEQPSAPAAGEAPVQKGLLPELTAENNIVTYRPLDPEKTTIVVSRTGNTYITNLCAAFEAANPDVQVVTLDITGGNSRTKPVVDWVANGAAPDVMFLVDDNFTDAELKESFENLSESPVIANYQTEALNRQAIDENIYLLPGPFKISCMIYNKTLFEQYGWKLPQTFDEFVSLCVQIREDTNGEVEPWNPNAKYSNEFDQVMEAFLYDQLFAGVENRSWYHDFCAGDASYSGHMAPLYDALQKLIDNGILREDHFSYSATTRGKEFAAGKIAMINYPITEYPDSAYEFGYMPFPGGTAGSGYVSYTCSCLVGVPKKARSEAERDAVERFLAFVSTPEGQEAFIGKSLMISSVKDYTNDGGQAMAALQECIDAGRLFTRLEYKTDETKANFSIQNDALAMLRGEKTAAECMAGVDAAPFRLQEAQEPLPVMATAAEDFSILEVSEYIADMYREKTGADIGLIANNLAYRGNLMRIFAGELTSSNVNTLLPRSLGNESTLVKTQMTGKQLLAALNDPLGNDITPDCIYAFSGLKCTVAPWAPLGEKYLSVALSDGTPIDENATYSVAFWEGTVKDAYITGNTEAFEGSWEALMTEKLTAEGTITPPRDGRITLVWD